jgi:hypothetical protein
MLMGRIVVDPEVRHGKPVIKGTRVSMDVILGSLAGGMSVEEVADEYVITRDDADMPRSSVKLIRSLGYDVRAQTNLEPEATLESQNKPKPAKNIEFFASHARGCKWG